MKRFFFFLNCFLIAGVAQAQFITNNGIPITNSALVITNGDWQNNGTLLNKGTIVTSESWVNNGTLDAAGRGSFILNYASDKNFKAGSPAIGSLIKKGTGAALVTGSIHIADTLMLLNGLVKLSSSSDTVFIKTPIVSANANSYVEGVVAHAGAGDRLFPFGRDGYYLPMQIYKMNASRATASVVAAPTGYTKGPGLEALISFPYVWKVTKKAAGDTAAYVELNYPNTLPIAANPIVAREVPGLKYASMGARIINNSGGRVTVKSYSRGLKGTFTVTKGFPGNFATDSLALVALYNSTGGSAWTSKTNWLTGRVDTWFGVTVTGQSITSINLPSNKLAGVVPETLVDILAVQTVNISNNAITSIPRFSDNGSITTLNVSNNKLDFGSLEANAAMKAAGITFTYTNQADLGQTSDVLVDVGSPYTFTAQTGGINNVYQWKRNGTVVNGGNAKSYPITSIGRTNMGQYVCEITNTTFPGLTIKTAPQKATAVTTLSGKLFSSAGTAASKGKITLFKVNTAGKYDTTAVQNIKADGTYKLEKIPLDDYQLLGFADTLTYARALPTYYENTIYWEEAKTIVVNNNLDNLNIVSSYKPTGVVKGTGVISGYVEEDNGKGGRTQKSERVENAGASVRRVERTGRPQGEILTLVAYVFSNANGEFTLPELPKGEYRLNIQYPGYPMDESSYITIPIGDGLQSQVKVAAKVESGKINVKKLVITSVWEEEGFGAEVYPNPSADFVNVKFNEISSLRLVELIDETGRKVTTVTASEKENQLDVRTYNPGVYVLRIYDRDAVVKIVRVVID